MENRRIRSPCGRKPDGHLLLPWTTWTRGSGTQARPAPSAPESQAFGLGLNFTAGSPGSQADPPSKSLAQPHPHSPSHEPGVSTGSGWGHGHLSGATVLSTMRVTSHCPLTGTWPSAPVLEWGAACGDSASSRRHGGASGKGPRGTAQAPDVHPQNARARGGAPSRPVPIAGQPRSRPPVPACSPRPGAGR